MDERWSSRSLLGRLVTVGRGYWASWHVSPMVRVFVESIIRDERHPQLRPRRCFERTRESPPRVTLRGAGGHSQVGEMTAKSPVVRSSVHPRLSQPDPSQTRGRSSREVGRWLVVHSPSRDAGPKVPRPSARIRPASPAAPYRTVHAVLPHTALRHRSPSGMRRPVANRSGQPVHPERAEPRPRVVGGPVSPRAPMADAGKDRESLMDVAVDRVELPREFP